MSQTAEPHSVRGELRAFLELFAVAGIAITQPVLDLLSKNTGVFVTRTSSVGDVVLVATLVALVPALALWCLEAFVGLVLPRLRRWIHALALAALVATFALEFVKRQTSLGPGPLIVIASVIGVAGGAAFLTFETARVWSRFLAIAPPLFVLLFLFFSPVTKAVFASQPQTAAAVKVAHPSRVVMVVMDEFPTESLLDGHGKIDAQLFPNFAALAGSSTWYRNETTVAPYTVNALPAIMSGGYPHGANALPIASEYPHNLFTLLGGTYRINAHEVVTALCPGQLCRERRLSTAGGGGLHGVISDTIALWRQFASPHRSTFSFNELGAALVALPTARDFVRSLHPATSPQLDFVHIELPHQPWQYDKALQRNENVAPAEGSKLLIWSSPFSAVVGRERHLLQVQACDTLLGEIIAKLKAIHAWDDTLFVLTADHGVAFTNLQPLRSVTKTNYKQIMWTPLFMKTPRQQEARVDDRIAQSVDVVPTIVDMLGVKSTWKFDGTSLLGAPRTDNGRHMYQWKSTTQAFQPPNVDTIAPGQDHLTYDGAQGFADVIKSTAAPPGADPDLRIYQIGAYPSLIGKRVAPFVGRERDSPTSASAAGTEYFGAIDPQAKTIPWTYISGYVLGMHHNEWLALSVNGRVAGFAYATEFTGKTTGYYWAVLAPQLFHAGKNTFGLYAIRGPADSPRLLSIPVN